jgi:hypothetical protein
MQEKQLRDLIITKLTAISILKGIQLSQIHFEIWTKKILEDSKQGLNLEKGFKKLETEKSYGGLDYAIFFEGAKISEEEKKEEVWRLVLKSAAAGGTIPIPARAGKALNSLRGMEWLREAPLSEVNWQKKEFMEAYDNTPEPEIIDFNCPGLEAPMYLGKDQQKLLEVNHAV